jgi:lysophospholipase L1-like esterase
MLGWFLLSVSASMALLIAEGAAGTYLAWMHRMPSLPAASRTNREAGRDVQVVVVGESSAEGVPYRDWLSVGKVVAWQLRRAVPWRTFHVEVQARPGWTLETMHQRLVESRARPDAVIIYAGHNEFASRYDWSSDVPYYRDDPPPWPKAVLHAIARLSPLSRLVGELHDRELVAAPPRRRSRRLVDVPSHTPAERAERLTDFRRRLEAMVTYCERVGALPILMIPPGNDAGFEPNRSVLPPETPRAEREAFVRDFEGARSLERSDPATAIGRYRLLLDRQPGFAETHFRLARLLEASGDVEAASRHYVAARDLDGHPMRCPTPFQDAYREVAARHRAILIDGQSILRARHPRGLLDDRLFNDAMHPSFEGHVALAEAVLAGLKERGAFGWPGETPAPRIDLAECADHFDVQVATWASACEFAASFYRTTGPIRFDSAERKAKETAYAEALDRLGTARTVSGLSVPGICLRPVEATARR